jgi:serine phosphatase RsbU (regulator of sigma subunit)
MFLVVANFAYYGSLLPSFGLAHWVRAVLEFRAFTVASVLAAILALLFRDQRQVTEERALLAGEMHAASQIQRMLAPAKLDCAPGLQIDVAFHPMREVGGDFYLSNVLPGGRQRIMLGDVSGKGSAAAMTATLLLGGAADRNSDSPAALLAHLNRILLKNRVGGFATCLCADIDPDGAVTLANAGHLSPYCRGEEIDTFPGLPLGIAAETNYAETALVLDPGESLTFLSDGVVEARNSSGELFGFDRTAAISTESAQSIAGAASTHGQEDDITVLTLTFAPAEVLYA